MQRLLGLINGNEALDETTLSDEQAQDARAFQAFAAAVEQTVRLASSSNDAPSAKAGLDWD